MSSTTTTTSVDKKRKGSEQESKEQQEDCSHLTKVESLNANTDNWTIRVCVTEKSNIRNFKSGGGFLFCADVVDIHPESTPSNSFNIIRLTGFNQSCTKFFPLLDEGKMYEISGGTIKKKNPAFNKLAHYYEIHLDEKETTITPFSCSSESNKRVCMLPQEKFITLSEVRDLESNAIFNTVVRIQALQPIISHITKAGKPTQYRNIHVVDHTLFEFILTIWGEKCDHEYIVEDAVIILKKVVVNDFASNRKIGTTHSTRYELANNDREEAKDILEWIAKTPVSQLNNSFYFTKISKDNFNKTLEKRFTCAELKEIIEAGGVSFLPHIYNSIIEQSQNSSSNSSNEKAPLINFKLRASVHSVKYEVERPLCFYVCSRENCKSKLTKEKNGFKCEKCQIFHQEPGRAYILILILYDETGSIEMVIFDDLAVRLLNNKKAGDLYIEAAKEIAEEQELSTSNNPQEDQKDTTTTTNKTILAGMESKRMCEKIEEMIRYKEFIWTLKEGTDKKNNRMQLQGFKANSLEESNELNKEEEFLFEELNKNL